MTLRQLSYVLAVARTRSFTRAAESLHVSQPALSQQIGALEAELGGALLVRRPGPVRLTPAGHALAAEATVAVTFAERAAHAARRAIGLQQTELAVCTTRALATTLLPNAINRWHVRHPAVVIQLIECADRRAVEQALLDGTAEVGVAPRPANWPGAVERLACDELVVVLPRSDPLLRSGGPVALRELADRGWVLFEPEEELAGEILRGCRPGGFTPRPAVEAADAEAAVRLAAAGAGPALAPLTRVPNELIDASRRLEPPVAWDVVAMTLGASWSPAAAALVALLARQPVELPEPGSPHECQCSISAMALTQRSSRFGYGLRQ